MELLVAFLLVKVFILLLHFLPEICFAFDVPKVARWPVLFRERMA